MLAALARETSRVRLGTLVTGVTYRNPALLAKQVTTLDTSSGGRAVLGLGAAWNDVEHEGYGFDFPPIGDRMDRPDEALAIIKSMFTEERPTFHGKHYPISQALNVPRPIQSGGPQILVGGGGERRTMRVAAAYADAWHTWATPEELARKNGVLDAHCADLGRDPSEIRRIGGRWVDDLDVDAHLASYAGVADEVVLLDHRDRPLADTVDMIRQAAP